MQFGKFHNCSNSLLILIHSLSVVGALTYWWCKAVQIASQVSPSMEQTVDLPKRKLKDSDTYYSGHGIITVVKQTGVKHTCEFPVARYRNVTTSLSAGVIEGL